MEKKGSEIRLAAVMVTRIDSFDRILGRDEAEAVKLLDFHNAYIGDIVEHHKGKVINTEGETLTAEYNNAKNAVACGLAIQKALVEYNRGVSLNNRFRLRIGIHLGDFQFQGSEITGKNLKIVSGLLGLSSPGRICLSADIFDAVSGKLKVRAESLGEKLLEGVEEKIQVYELFPGLRRTAAARSTERNERAEREAAEDTEESSRSSRLLSGNSFLDRVDQSRGVAMDSFQDRHPEAGRKLLSFIDRLAQKGVLKKVVRKDGISEYSLASIKDLSNLKKAFEKDREAPKPLPGGGYIIKPSIFAVGIAGLAGISILIGILSSGFVFPIIIIAGVLFWAGPRRKRWNRWNRWEEGWQSRRPVRNDYFEARGGSESHRSVVSRSEDAILLEARETVAKVVSELKASSELASRLGNDILSLLDEYVGHMEPLAERSGEINRLLKTMPIEALEKDREKLLDILKKGVDENVKKDYEHSIRQIEKQRVYYEKLQNQRELIQRKLKSALSSLKQLHANIERMKGVTASQEDYSLDSLMEKSRELSAFLDNLKREHDFLD
jgi:class 3 adenylate cyclase